MRAGGAAGFAGLFGAAGGGGGCAAGGGGSCRQLVGAGASLKQQQQQAELQARSEVAEEAVLRLRARSPFLVQRQKGQGQSPVCGARLAYLLGGPKGRSTARCPEMKYRQYRGDSSWLVAPSRPSLPSLACSRRHTRQSRAVRRHPPESLALHQAFAFSHLLPPL